MSIESRGEFYRCTGKRASSQEGKQSKENVFRRPQQAIVLICGKPYWVNSSRGVCAVDCRRVRANGRRFRRASRDARL